MDEAGPPCRWVSSQKYTASCDIPVHCIISTMCIAWLLWGRHSRSCLINLAVRSAGAGYSARYKNKAKRTSWLSKILSREGKMEEASIVSL